VVDASTRCWEQITVPHPSEAHHAAEQQYRHWGSQSKAIFESSESVMREELRTEAAIILQRWFRSGHLSTSCCSSAAEEDDVEEADCDDSQANVMVRRAFMESTYSGFPGKTAFAKSDCAEDYWSMEEVTHWMNQTFDNVLETEDRILGARTLWCEWATVELHFPAKFRHGTVKLLDKKLQACGRPSLRELVFVQDGSSNSREAG